MPDRRFRVGVRVLKAELKESVSSLVKVTIGALKEKSSLASGTEPTWNLSCAFEVMDPVKDVVSVTVEKGTGSISFLSRDIYGSVDIPVKDYLWTVGSPFPKYQQFDLKGFDGKSTGAKVTAQIILVEAPAQSVPIKCLVGTWNVGNEAPSADLTPWLRTDNAAHELIAIGSQECTYTQRPPHASCEADWVAALEAAVGPNYMKVRSDSLGQMRLVIFARVDVFPAMQGHDSASEATGVGHVGTNKGGVASVVWVWDTSICFVNSHLAAHQGKTNRRNSDYKEIVEQVALGTAGLDILHQFHHTVWMGDLNYRLDLGEIFGPAANAKTPPKEVFDKIQEMCSSGNTAEMLRSCQLKQSIAAKKGFVGFNEGEIKHLPTFKVKRAEGFVYNTQRSPAYCDRVLWRSLPGYSVTQTELWCSPEVASSDHKPVGCWLELQRAPCRPRWLPRKPKNVLTGQVRKSKGHVQPDTHNQVPTWELQLTALKGSDLMSADYTGKSDPYVVFLGDSLMYAAHTDFMAQTLNPEWTPKRLPKIVLFGASEEALMNEHICVLVMDYDATSPDDPIGNGVIRVKDLFTKAKAGGGTAAFEVPLMFGGIPKGELTGKLTVKEGAKTTVIAIRNRKPVKIAPSKEFSLARLFGLGPKPPPEKPAKTEDRSAYGSMASSGAEEDEDDDLDGSMVTDGEPATPLAEKPPAGTQAPPAEKPQPPPAAPAGEGKEFHPGNTLPDKASAATESIAPHPTA